MTNEDEKDLEELRHILRPHGMDATLTSGPDPRVPPTTPLTAEEIAELRRLDAAATPPPWTEGAGEAELHCGPDTSSRFIAAARNALPRLLDEVERARALLKRIEYLGVRIDVDGSRVTHRAACPECGAPGVPKEPHRPSCELAALIGGKE